MLPTSLLGIVAHSIVRVCHSWFFEPPPTILLEIPFEKNVELESQWKTMPAMQKCIRGGTGVDGFFCSWCTGTNHCPHLHLGRPQWRKAWWNGQTLSDHPIYSFCGTFKHYFWRQAEQMNHFVILVGNCVEWLWTQPQALLLSKRFSNQGQFIEAIYCLFLLVPVLLAASVWCCSCVIGDFLSVFKLDLFVCWVYWSAAWCPVVWFNSSFCLCVLFEGNRFIFILLIVFSEKKSFSYLGRYRPDQFDYYKQTWPLFWNQ